MPRVEKNGAKAIPDNIDELYAQARQSRAVKCNEEIKAALSKHNCDMQIVIGVGENQVVPLNQVLALPGIVRVTPK